MDLYSLGGRSALKVQESHSTPNLFAFDAAAFAPDSSSNSAFQKPARHTGLPVGSPQAEFLCAENSCWGLQEWEKLNQAGCSAEMKSAHHTGSWPLYLSCLPWSNITQFLSGRGLEVFQKLPYGDLADLKFFQQQLEFALLGTSFQSCSLPSVSLLCASEMMASTRVCFVGGIGRRLESKEKPSTHLAKL